METISVKSLNELMAKEAINLIDVREKEEYDSFHIPCAKNIPLSDVYHDKMSLDKEDTYYIVCKGGTRSRKAAEFLADHGYNVVDVMGGTLAWGAMFPRS